MHSQELIEVAWVYVLQWNKEHKEDPRFVDEYGAELISKTPKCDGSIHIGHGPGNPCQRVVVEA